jgi:hypothetical protein
MPTDLFSLLRAELRQHTPSADPASGKCCLCGMKFSELNISPLDAWLRMPTDLFSLLRAELRRHTPSADPASGNCCLCGMKFSELNISPLDAWLSHVAHELVKIITEGGK